MPRRKLRLYVWENVLTDYSSGIMFALARDVEEARKVIMTSAPFNSVENELKQEPKVFDEPCGFVVWGGG
jgi:hypothetical protein